MYDVERIRAAFPALQEGLARFDAPGGSLVPQSVADAVASALTSGLCQRGDATEPQRRTEQTVADARTGLAALLDGDPRGVVFGRSMTALTFDLARTLGRTWSAGDEVVLCRLDHDADVRPWVIAAERAGVTVRWLGFDPATGEADDVAPLLSSRTRLVALTGASNLIGTRPDVRAVADAAHAVGALVHVDAVHLVPHAPTSITELGADVVSCSPYKFFGPHLGAQVAAPTFWEDLTPDKLLPSTDVVPERFELGTLPYELLAGVAAAVDFIADLVPSAGSLRERVVASMTEVEAHEAALLTRLLSGLDALPHVTVHGRAGRRTPTVALTFADRTAEAVSRDLAEAGVLAPSGTFYAHETAAHAGLADGVVRVGLAAYTTTDEVDRLLAGLAHVTDR